MKPKSLLLTSLIFTMFHFAMCQTTSQSRNEIDLVWDHYERYKEPAIINRFFKHSELIPLIQKHTASKLLNLEEIGKSVKGRSINHLSMGSGKTKVLLWSQMHGDESTATMALFDLFNFFEGKDEHNDLRKLILENLELHFIPMLNPDGAQQWKRRNELDIDINRDARLLVTPEARALMGLAKRIQPEIGFNLHDQNILTSAGRSQNTATISFLAPTYNYPKDMNDVRKKATQLLLTMNNALQTKVPGKTGKYDDAFDPRSFGDTFQGMGISTILIESGGYYQDPEKQYIRKLNFYALLTAFEAIANQSYKNVNIKDYDAIPENNRSLYDLLVRNVSISKEGETFRTNLGINQSQIKGAGFASMLYNGRIDELGDVELMYGYDEIDASSLTLNPGKVKLLKKREWEALSPQQEMDFLKQGYLYIKWSDGKSPTGPVRNRLLNLTNNSTVSSGSVGLGRQAQFLLTRGDKPVYAVVNGYKVDLNAKAGRLMNTYGY